MKGNRRIAVVLLGVLVVAAVGGGVWYFVIRDSRDQGTGGLQWTQNARLTRGFLLVPVPVTPPAKAPPLEEVWKDLFPNMAKDAETKKLMGELLGGVPYEFVVLDPDEKVPENFPSTPPHERAIILGVRPGASTSAVWRSPNGTGERNTRPGPETPEADKYIRCLDVRLTLIYLEHSPSGGADIKNVEILAANEYLIRHQLGCLLCTELTPVEYRAITGSADGARAHQTRELDEARKQLGLPPRKQ
jgi:hypothetical protein